jgi:hypothetical protein
MYASGGHRQAGVPKEPVARTVPREREARMRCGPIRATRCALTTPATRGGASMRRAVTAGKDQESQPPTEVPCIAGASQSI